MRNTTLRIAAWAAVLFLLVGGCHAGMTRNTAPSPVGADLLSIHDPKKVTYSRTLTTGQCRTSANGSQLLPDRSCTPGSIDPQATVALLCRPGGYTASVRPPVRGSAGTGIAKTYAYRAYSMPAGTVSELDHLVPLSLGGSNDIANLWPEPGVVPNPKDRVELALHDAVCTHLVNLATAQQAIATDWSTALSVLRLPDSASTQAGTSGD